MCYGWERSAKAWIADMGDRGDFTREFVLDEPMIARVEMADAQDILDLGCGEGRFCRMMSGAGRRITGVEPTRALKERAQSLDEAAGYVSARAEMLPFADDAFDLVVSYLTLVDIEGLDAALNEVARVLRPGGRFLIANLSSFATAIPEGLNSGWIREEIGDGVHFTCDDYHTVRSIDVAWRGINVRNHHRPQEVYMSGLLNRGFNLVHFEEPAPTGGPAKKVALYRRAPMFVVMEWQLTA